MKKIFFTFLAFIILIGCSNSSFNNNNPYLNNVGFTVDINLDLPTNSNLNFAGNGIANYNPGVGINGILIFNTGSGYRAYEASCPNQPITSCSRMILNGANAVCPCDDVEYSLFTGLAQNVQKDYPLKPYRTELIGNTIRIYN